MPARMKTPGRCFHAERAGLSPVIDGRSWAVWSIANISAALQNDAHTKIGVWGVLNAA
jgi:hypothetical protein